MAGNLAADSARRGQSGFEAFAEAWRESRQDPDAFWAKRARELLSFERAWLSVCEAIPDSSEHAWFKGAKLNVCYNCLDRHVEQGRGGEPAVIWQGEPEGESRSLSYAELLAEVCRFANLLKSLGVGRGSRVCLYLPQVPELAVAMLACARLGAAYCAVGAGYSAMSLERRLRDCGAEILIIADGAYLSGQVTPLKPGADQALVSCPEVKKCLVLRRCGNPVAMTTGRDYWLNELLSAEALGQACPCSLTGAEDQLFIAHAADATGQALAMSQAAAGYLLQAAHSAQWLFDLRQGDLVWCACELSSAAGQAYGFYGPLTLGAATLLYESGPGYPGPDRVWKIIEERAPSVFCVNPVLARSLVREGEGWAERRNLSSLRLLANLGEPLKSEDWQWLFDKAAGASLPLVEAWLQTATGCAALAALPFASQGSPGVCGLALPGVEALVMVAGGVLAGPGESGELVLRPAWPGLPRPLPQYAAEFERIYFSRWPGYYASGELVSQDADGCFSFLGRLAESGAPGGWQASSADIESALAAHPAVGEVCALSPGRGEAGDKAQVYVSLLPDWEDTQELRDELWKLARKAAPGLDASSGLIRIVCGLPKTKSGKLARTALRKLGQEGELAMFDTSTLDDPALIDEILTGKSGLFG